jgi:hypothetical protein
MPAINWPFYVPPLDYPAVLPQEQTVEPRGWWQVASTVTCDGTGVNTNDFLITN